MSKKKTRRLSRKELIRKAAKKVAMRARKEIRVAKSATRTRKKTSSPSGPKKKIRPDSEAGVRFRVLKDPPKPMPRFYVTGLNRGKVVRPHFVRNRDALKHAVRGLARRMRGKGKVIVFPVHYRQPDWILAAKVAR